jgi:hypothetical protein
MNQIPPVLSRYINGLKAHDVAAIATTVADGVAFISATRTLDKQQFLAFLTALYAAFPDWHYEHDEPEVRGDGSIAIRWRQGGTHTGVLALPASPSVAPTGKVVRIPGQFFFYKVAGRQIVEIRPQPTPGGAPGGILEQIGVANPSL